MADDSKIASSEAEWKRKLAPEQYHVLREQGTERPFTGKYWDEHAKGVYHCAACGAELFSSDAKFDSGTGWPSFTEPANLKNVELCEDNSYGLPRTAVRCKKCGSHLGHVFDDPPRSSPRQPASPERQRGEISSEASKLGEPEDKGGKRYCINSVCLELRKKEEKNFVSS